MIVFTNRIIQCLILEEETRCEKDKDKQSLLRAERNAIRARFSDAEYTTYWSFRIEMKTDSIQVPYAEMSMPNVKMPDFSKCIFVS